MKSSSKTILLSVPVLAYLFLCIVHMTSCQSAGNQPNVPLTVSASFPLNLTNVLDTSGNKLTPHYVSGALPSGSKVVMVCVGNICPPGADSSAGAPKIVFSGTLTQDIPANTELVLRVVSNDVNFK
jgi:hypothetical protein